MAVINQPCTGDAWEERLPEQEPETFAFSYIIERLRSEPWLRCIRKGWNGKGFWVSAQLPDEKSNMTHPYYYIMYPVGHPAYLEGSKIPWFPSQTDLWAQDWMIL